MYVLERFIILDSIVIFNRCFCSVKLIIYLTITGTGVFAKQAWNNSLQPIACPAQPIS